MVDRRGFIASLGALSAAVLLPAGGAGLAESAGMATVSDASAVAEWMKEVYSSKAFFSPYKDDYSPLLDDLDADPGWSAPR